jgi:hypothetical protein
MGLFKNRTNGNEHLLSIKILMSVWNWVNCIIEERIAEMEPSMPFL